MKLSLIEYTPAAKQRSFDPYNSAVNVAPAFGTKHSRSELTANKQLAKTAANSKRYS